MTRSRPSGLLRWFLRAPIWLYRARLGWLFGKRFLLLQHKGRKSGLPRYAVVEVVTHDPATDTWFISSGWGRKSDWFRNIQRDPHVAVTVGARRFAAVAEELDVGAATQALLSYATRHSAAFRKLGEFMIGEPLEATEADARRLAEQVPVVALRPAAA